MKKFLTTLVSSLVIVCVGAASVLAAGSTQDVVEITKSDDGAGNEVNYTLTEVSSEIPPLTAEIASKENGVPASELKVLWQKDLTADVLPATFTYHVNGADGKTLYSFHWNGQKWELMNSATGPDITTKYTSLSPVGIVIRVPANNSTSTTTSPKTGDSVVLYTSIAVVVVACSAAFVVAATTKKD